MFQYSLSLDKIANEKADEGARAELKKSAYEYVSCGDHHKIVSTYELASRLGHLREDMTITLVSINQGVLIYHKPIEEVQSIIEAIEYKPKGKVSSKVLQKMTYRFLKSIHEIVVAGNAYEKQRYEWALQSQKNNLNFPTTIPAPVVIVMPEFRTVKQLNDWLIDFANPGTLNKTTSRWQFSQLHKKMHKKLLRKPELADQDISGGTDLLISDIVMGS